MNDLSKNDRSKLRIAGMCLAHCERFRLLRLRDRKPDGTTLIAFATEALDLFEKCLVASENSPNTDCDNKASCPGGQPTRSRKKVEKSVLDER